MNKKFFSSFSFIFFVFISIAQQRTLPVIDMHLHSLHADEQGPPPLKIGVPFRDFGVHDPANDYRKAFNSALKTSAWADKFIISPTTDDSLRELTLAQLRKYNVYGVASGDPELLRAWKKQEPKRIINSLDWNFGLAKKYGLTVDTIEKLFRSCEFKVFGEVTIQYEGFAPSDTAFEPYLALAEKLDIPVGIHVGCGPPGAPYIGAVNYRARLHSPLGLEEALLKHPGLRVYAMHAGWPMIDDMIATMYTHPQLHVDFGVICYMLPKKEFYFYLERLVNAGFGKRIMFGSDNMVWPQSIGEGIETINKATFLTAEQKEIFYSITLQNFYDLLKKKLKTCFSCFQMQTSNLPDDGKLLACRSRRERD